MEKGFFKQEGADVSGILSSSGGGTTIRNLIVCWRQARRRASPLPRTKLRDVPATH
jgi:hypothetical protein